MVSINCNIDIAMDWILDGVATTAWIGGVGSDVDIRIGRSPLKANAKPMSKLKMKTKRKPMQFGFRGKQVRPIPLPVQCNSNKPDVTGL